MAASLGILVRSCDHLDKLIRLTKAARKKRIDVTIFLTHLGTLLIQDPKFPELEDLAEITVCRVAFESHGMTPADVDRDESLFATQAKHADMIYECDRYVVF
ncbi:MAG: DsrE family protein [Desulfatiglans sp.]|jgi:hypothetical protein|nr:DsrE family protein [Thermodesulfobacteriota bacterium]MEE4354526.1 DsrE family protein [Desulfatiglans sp.]